MHRASSFLTSSLLIASSLLSCHPRSPDMAHASSNTLAGAFDSALQTEQTGGANAALDAYLSLVERSVAAPDDPDAEETLLACLDALVFRSQGELEKVSQRHALSFRIEDGVSMTRGRLEGAFSRSGAAAALTRSSLARSLWELALFSGDVEQASRWKAQTGCVTHATLIGPLAWPPLTSLDAPTAAEQPNEKLAASYPGVAPFADKVRPIPVDADGCSLPLRAESSLEGVKLVVVDLDLPRASRVGVVFHGSSAAVVTLGGKTLFLRTFDGGGQEVQMFAQSDLPAGVSRLAARVADNGESSGVQLDVFDEHGDPVITRAPAPGQAAPGVPTRVHAWTVTAPTHTPPRAPTASSKAALLPNPTPSLAAAAMLALGDTRGAEHLLETWRSAPNGAVSPEAELLYARSLQLGSDLPETRSTERAREAYEHVSSRWPNSWEARIAHAQLTSRRHGTADGPVELLRELSNVATPSAKPQEELLAFAAQTAAQAGLWDLARTHLQRARDLRPRSPLVTSLELQVHKRPPSSFAEATCREPLIDQGGTSCLQARILAGQRQAALVEIARLRKLRGSPSALRNLELAQYVALGQIAHARATYDAMLPAERVLGMLGLLREAPEEVTSRLTRDAATAADAPTALAAVRHAIGLDPAATLENDSARLVAEDRKKHGLAGAATSVLAHRESYDLRGDGLLHYTLYDLRRVSGTTDVDQGVQSEGALVEGRDVRKTLRKRIHKADGKIIEPDAASQASQEHAELSQLQRGDYVEIVSEGWALPGASGQLIVDTQDLLPERTSVESATIEVRRPAALPLSIWAHRFFGKPEERTSNGEKVTTYSLRDIHPRRMEGGMLRTDRDVAISFGTATWDTLAASLREAQAALDEHDPAVSRWVQTIFKDKPMTSRTDAVQRIAQATGKVIKTASGAPLADSVALFGGGAQVNTTRAMIELGQGSRTWLAYRALRELEIPSEIVVAEREPYTTDTHYPPHFGRFDDPLLVAHVDHEDLWLDLDVPGPPLPAGKVSPERRGRLAMNRQGKLIQVMGAKANDARDEVELTLRVDRQGNGVGTFSLSLQGRTAQALAEALEKEVGSDRQQILRSVVLGWFPWANVDQVSLSSSEGSWNIGIAAQVTIPGYAQVEGSDWMLPGLEPVHVMFPRAGVDTLGSTFAGRGARKEALAIERAIQYRVKRTVILPEGSSLRANPPQFTLDHELLGASRTEKHEESKLTEEFVLSLSTGSIEPARYEAFAERARRVDDAFMTSTRVTPPTP